MPKSDAKHANESREDSSVQGDSRAQENLSGDEVNQTKANKQGNGTSNTIRVLADDGDRKRRKLKGFTIPRKELRLSDSHYEEDNVSSRSQSEKSDSSTSSDSESSTSSEDSDSSASSDVTSRRHFDRTKGTREKIGARSPELSKGLYEMYDPEVNESAWKLNKNLQHYVDKHFSKYIKDKTLQENILEVHPLPETESLEVRKVDGYIDTLFQAKGISSERGIDRSLCQVQQKILNTMAPLTKLWSDLHVAKTESASPSLDLDETLTLLDQSVLLVGQANVSLNYQRRLSVLTKLTKDVKRSRTILSKHNDILQKPDESLFGHKFERVISKIAKSRKRARELADELGPSTSFKKKKFPMARKGNQPFRQGPSRGGHNFGGRVSFNSFRKQGGSQQKKTRF
ncbi:uncharacterized protein LOC144439453 [Glandiceps talaboti]